MSAVEKLTRVSISIYLSIYLQGHVWPVTVTLKGDLEFSDNHSCHIHNPRRYQQSAFSIFCSTFSFLLSFAQSERDGDSGLGDGGVSCSPTEYSHPSSRPTGPDGIKTEINQSDTPVDAPPPTSGGMPSSQSSPDGPGSSHGLNNAPGGDIDLDSSRTESTTNSNCTNSASATSSAASSGRGTRRGGGTGGGSVTSKGSSHQSASGEENGGMANNTAGCSGNPSGQTQGGGSSSNTTTSSNSRRRRATGSLASGGRGVLSTSQQPTDGIEEEEGDREGKVEGSSFADGEDDQNLSRGTSLPEGSNGKGGGGDSGGGPGVNSASSSGNASSTTTAAGMLAGSTNSNSKTIRGQKKPVGRVSNWEMELLAQKFPLRGEVLGEDRFLNRYFLVPTALGVPRIFVEAFSQMNRDVLLEHAEAFVNGYLQHIASTGTGSLPTSAQEDEDKRKEELSIALHPSTSTTFSPTNSTSFSSQATAGATGRLAQQTTGSAAAAAGNVGGVVGHQGGGGPSQAQTQQQQGVHQAAAGGIGEIGRRSSRRIALKEEQRQQQEQLDALAALQSGGGGGGALGKSSDDKKRKRGGALQNGALGRGSGRNSATGGAGGSTLATTASGGSLEQQKYKKANAFVRRAVGFPSISLFLQYLEETIRSCRLYVVPPGQPIQQLQHALSPYMLKERALKEKIRRVDQQVRRGNIRLLGERHTTHAHLPLSPG